MASSRVNNVSQTIKERNVSMYFHRRSSKVGKIEKLWFHKSFVNQRGGYDFFDPHMLKKEHPEQRNRPLTSVQSRSAGSFSKKVPPKKATPNFSPLGASR